MSSSFCTTRQRVLSVNNSPASPRTELHQRLPQGTPPMLHPPSLKLAVYGDETPLTSPVLLPKEDNQPKLFGLPLKYVSLLTLAVQNASLTIIMHYSRISTPPNKTYSAGSAVLLNELLKGSLSMVIALMRIDPDDRKSRSSTTSIPVAPKHEYSFLARSKRTLAAASPRSITRFVIRWRRLAREIFSTDCWKLSIPAILYVIQNNLQFVAASNLDVATFQVTYQMKILTTAAFSVLLLRKQLSMTKWLALLGLAVGVGIVQIQSGSATHALPKALGNGEAVTEKVVRVSAQVMNPLKGFLAVAAACMTSGLAGVYFEMVLKGSQADLWVRNVQLSLFSLLPALVPIIFSSGPSPNAFPWYKQVFQNFGGWAWATVLIQVFGGLVTAVVIKYSDNIMKGFATSLSIVISFLASVALFDFRITLSFIIGSAVVLGATWFYNAPERKPIGGGANPEEKANSDGGIGLGINLPSLSRQSSSAIGSPVDSDDPIIGETSPRKKSPLPTPRAIANALGRAVSSGNTSPTEAYAPHQTVAGGVNGGNSSGAGSPFPSAPPSRKASLVNVSGTRNPSLGGFEPVSLIAGVGSGYDPRTRQHPH